MAKLEGLYYIRGEFMTGKKGLLWCAPIDTNTDTIPYTRCDLSRALRNTELLDKEYVLCSEDDSGNLKEIQALWAPFDKRRAPRTYNLLVYINGQILWDNVRLAQRAKG